MLPRGLLAACVLCLVVATVCNADQGDETATRTAAAGARAARGEGEFSQQQQHAQQEELAVRGGTTSAGSVWNDPTDLFPMFTGTDGAGSGLLVFSILLSSCSGIGGGGLFIPIFLFVFSYHLSVAHMLSHVMVLLSAVAQTLINATAKDADGTPAIKLRTCAVLTPVFLAGHGIGVTIFPLCPSELIEFLLAALLGVVAFQTGRKFVEAYKKEHNGGKGSSDNKLLHERLTEEQDQEQEEGSQTPDPENGGKRGRAMSSLDISLRDRSSSRPIRTFPFMAVFLLFGVWMVMFVVYLIMGGKDQSGVIPGLGVCSVGYWLVFIAGVITCGLIAALAAKLLLASEEGSQYGKGGVVWLIAVSAVGGIFAGLVGIGGAQFTVPILLTMGLNGVAASSTSAVAVIVAVSSDVARAAIVGQMKAIPHLVLWTAGLAFVSAICGRSLSIAIVRRFNRTAPIVFLQFIVLSLCAVLSLVSGVRDLKQGDPFVFSTAQLC